MIEKIVGIAAGLLILGVIIWVTLNLLVAFAKAAFGLSLFTGIGFIVSVILAARSELPTPQKVGFIFLGTVLSYAAGSLIPTFLDNLFAGQYIAAVVILGVIVYIWVKAQGVKAQK